MSVEVFAWLKNELDLDLQEAKTQTLDFIKRLQEDITRLEAQAGLITLPAAAPAPSAPPAPVVQSIAQPTLAATIEVTGTIASTGTVAPAITPTSSAPETSSK